MVREEGEDLVHECVAPSQGDTHPPAQCTELVVRSLVTCGASGQGGEVSSRALQLWQRGLQRNEPVTREYEILLVTALVPVTL